MSINYLQRVAFMGIYKKHIRNAVTLLAAGSVCSLFSLPAAAQIIYSPSPTNAVPTLGSYALIALCIGLALVALASLKQRKGPTGGVILILLATSLGSGIAGLKLIEEAHAGGGASAVTGLIDSPTGGMVPITNGSLNIFENTSGVRQRIDDVVLPAGCANPDSGAIDGAPQCRAGGFVSTDVNGMCYADCR